jgi:hypothetical protein
VYGLREQVDLVGVATLGQDNLGLVALLGGEDLVHLGSRDGEGALEACELLLVDERRVGEVADRDLGEVTGYVLFCGRSVSSCSGEYLSSRWKN